MLLMLIAERPAEVCGARWDEDVDLTGSLYDARHTRLSWMADNGVPDTVVSVIRQSWPIWCRATPWTATLCDCGGQSVVQMVSGVYGWQGVLVSTIGPVTG
ncbi:hypothetical protein M878_06250 [Streptomyces roseochromogenus subsp. oscitans DS 12.976]|uniref:Uncharacterized protein n=1 Tax=Streptomyces roseochromogenus subsp. oscitans DS 12.976 TaxID=1352936 RepID=V6L2H6_STRRC|nr:hypothetical protein M878_06250 [Streptomyces roseochromogenus subsp. oscitans DS 12.976]